MRNLQADNSGFWKNLWNLNIAPKVKIFLWRATNNCLPTKDLLRVKQVAVNEIFPVCNVAPESISYSHFVFIFSIVFTVSCISDFGR